MLGTSPARADRLHRFARDRNLRDTARREETATTAPRSPDRIAGGYSPRVRLSRTGRRTFVLAVLAIACTQPRASTAPSSAEPTATPPSSTPPPVEAVVRIALVRHAEKQTEPPADDPPLTPEGQARARALVDALPDVKAILSTDTLRTRQTATPVAEATGLTIETMEPLDVAKIRTTADALDGGTLLVVGHSNTLPELLHALAGATVDVPETAYGDLFIIHLADPPKLERLRFGP